MAKLKHSEFSSLVIIDPKCYGLDRTQRIGFKSIFLTVLSIIFVNVNLTGQTNPSESQHIQITTYNGTLSLGVLIREDENQIIIKTESGILTVDKVDIKDIWYDISMKEKLYSGSHYLFGQSAYGLKKGQIYYENTYLAVNSFSFAITDRFSLTTGFELVALIGGQVPLVYASPKYSVPLDGGAFSLSLPIGLSIQEGKTLGGLQASLTIGSTEHNVTFGGGYGYQTGDFARSFGIFQIAGITKVSERVSLTSENYIYIDGTDTTPVISFGTRFHSKKRKSIFFTIAVVVLNLESEPEDLFGLLPLPFFSWTVALK